jgi:hypothetical protein
MVNVEITTRWAALPKQYWAMSPYVISSSFFKRHLDSRRAVTWVLMAHPNRMNEPGIQPE